MATFKLDIQYKMDQTYWTNKLYISAADLPTARQALADIAALLATAIQSEVIIDRGRITQSPYLKNTFVEVPLNIQGSGGGTPPAPLFNVVRWVFTRGHGRGVNHYFRGGVTPSNIGSFGQFTQAAQAFNTSIVQQLFDLPYIICDAQGQQYVFAAASPIVGMRQLRRGSKRKTKPVI